MPTRTRYSACVIRGLLSLAGSSPWRIRHPCTGAPGRDFSPDVGTTATSGRRSPPEVLSAAPGGIGAPPEGAVTTSEMVQGGIGGPGTAPPEIQWEPVDDRR